MSLLSEKDHKMVIKAIDWYINQLDSNADAEEIASYHALLNWIKIQNEKF